MNDNDSRGSSTMMGFALGALVGAGLALLLAPASGEETRRRIGDSARRLRDGARDTLDQARDKVSDKVEAFQDGAREKLEQARGRVEDIQEGVRAGVEAARQGDSFRKQGSNPPSKPNV